MRKLFGYLLALPMLAMGLFACSEDNGNGGMVDEPDLVKNPVYLKVGIQMPSTRGTTTTDGESTDGKLDATAAESKVNEVLIIFCAKSDNAFIAQKVISTAGANGETLTPDPTGTNYTALAVYDAGGLNSYANKEVNVFAFCNPTAQMKAKAIAGNNLLNEKLPIAADGAIDGIWSDNKFVMSNASIKSFKFPGDFSMCKTPEQALNLGTIDVQRVAARFDYKAAKEANTYVLQQSAEGSEVEVVLNSMSLVNLSKECFLMKYVSNQTDGYTQPELLASETATNYVVDTDAAFKAVYTGAESTADNFTNAFMSAATTWSWNALGTNTAEYEKVRYGVENTIPAVDQQMNGISTGVAFLGSLKAGAKCPAALAEVINAGAVPVYVYGNVLYGSWEQVGIYAAANPDDAVSIAYAAVNKSNADATALAKAGFTGITPRDGKYNMVYYYWNRHNDNMQPALMGVMEFAVVRNNVYQLCVTNINRYGHPENSSDPDPDPKDPKTPDEEVNKAYLTVSVNVLPWVKRVNNIEF